MWQIDNNKGCIAHIFNQSERLKEYLCWGNKLYIICVNKDRHVEYLYLYKNNHTSRVYTAATCDKIDNMTIFNNKLHFVHWPISSNRACSSIMCYEKDWPTVYKIQGYKHVMKAMSDKLLCVIYNTIYITILDSKYNVLIKEKADYGYIHMSITKNAIYLFEHTKSYRVKRSIRYDIFLPDIRHYKYQTDQVKKEMMAICMICNRYNVVLGRDVLNIIFSYL